MAFPLAEGEVWPSCRVLGHEVAQLAVPVFTFFGRGEAVLLLGHACCEPALRLLKGRVVESELFELPEVEADERETDFIFEY